MGSYRQRHTNKWHRQWKVLWYFVVINQQNLDSWLASWIWCHRIYFMFDWYSSLLLRIVINEGCFYRPKYINHIDIGIRYPHEYVLVGGAWKSSVSVMACSHNIYTFITGRIFRWQVDRFNCSSYFHCYNMRQYLLNFVGYGCSFRSFLDKRHYRTNLRRLWVLYWPKTARSHKSIHDFFAWLNNDSDRILYRDIALANKSWR